MFEAIAQVHIGWAIAVTSAPREGMLQMREALAQQTKTGNRLGIASWLGAAAEAHADAGLGAKAAAALDEAFGALGEEEVWRPDLLRVRGDLLARQGDDLDAAESAYREAIERAHAMGALLFELRAATGLARLLQRRGRTGEAHSLLAPVFARFTDGATWSKPARRSTLRRRRDLRGLRQRAGLR